MSKSINSKLDELKEDLQSFRNQYDRDMRGDLKKDIGIIGRLRRIEKRQNENPSITYLLRNKPLRTTGLILFVFAFLSLLWDTGILQLAGKLGAAALIAP